ncbi:MAG: CHASE2 domain-containing protein [Bryobacteraceae bacterium]
MRDASLSAIVTGAVLAALYLQPPIVVNGDWRAYDLLNGLTPRAGPSGQVAIVTVDDSSLARLGRWPWPRDVLGLVIRKPLDAGARAVVLDVMFPEPDLSPPGLAQLALPGVAGEFASGPERQKTNDEFLADAIAKGRVVAGYSFDFQEASAGRECVLHPVSIATTARAGIAPPALFKAPGVLCPVATITRAATGTGFLNASPDADGQMRRIPLLVEYNNRAYPSLALATMLALRPKTTLSLVSDGLGSHHVQIDDTTIPVDNRSRLLIRYRGRRGTFPSVSAADVVDSPAIASTLANKIVVLGGAAAGLQDYATTPVDPLMLGVEVQATLIDNLLTGDFARRSPLSSLWEGLLVILGAAATMIVLTRVKPLAGALIALGMCAALWAGAAFVLFRTQDFVSPFLPTVALAGNFAVLTVSNWSRQKASAEKTKRDLEAMRRFTVAAMAAMAEARHPETARHARRLQRYMALLCEGLAHHPRFRGFLTPKTVALLIELTPVHDIGKVGIPDSILLKNGPLTAEEFGIIKRHVDHGRRILESAYKQSGLEDSELLRQACDIVSAHHERWDGSGYPEGLRGDAIPIPARLLAVADVYDAMVSKRVYKDAMLHSVAYETIKAGRGTDFDPDVVDAFLLNHETWEIEAETSRDRAAGRSAGA